MKTNEVVKTLMKEQGITPKILAGRLDETHNTMCERLKREHWSVRVLIQTLRALDCKLMVVPVETKETKNTYTITLD